MPEQVYYAEDPEGVLRRWHPDKRWKEAAAELSREAGKYRNALADIEELFYAESQTWEERAELMRAVAKKAMTGTE